MLINKLINIQNEQEVQYNTIWLFGHIKRQNNKKVRNQQYFNSLTCLLKKLGNFFKLVGIFYLTTSTYLNMNPIVFLLFEHSFFIEISEPLFNLNFYNPFPKSLT